MNRKCLFSSRQSLPLLAGTVALTLLTFFLIRGGNRAMEDVGERTGGGAAADQRELVTIRLDSKWKLKRASWGSVEVPPKPAAAEQDPSDPLAEKFKGLDVAVIGQR